MSSDYKNWDSIIEDNEAFRDQIATVDHKGDRIWIYPKQPKGRFYNARIWVSFAFLAIFLIMPFIRVNGEQFLLFNVLERKFVLFGLLFTPQDFHLFVLATLTFVVFIILFTVVYGRLFCGWVCPQTVFMEMFFRRIEYWIEGDANEQRRLDAAPWTNEKIRKKALKHLIFFAIAVVVANYFLAYIIGMDQVLNIIREPVSQHWAGFTGMLVFSGVFYFVFARLREQVCTTICPYGRLQGVLLVKESIVVAYDSLRGEPRGKLRKQKAAEEMPPPARLGDCIDCKLCIAVCPTGIDIRNGTQLECVNCTACMDACDFVMDKVERPRQLIRYDSMTGIETGKRKIFTPRVLAYTGVLVALILVDVLLLANRGLVETIILRSPGQLYQEKDETHLTNLYTYTIINKSPQDLPVELKLVSPQGKLELVGQAPGQLEKGSKKQGAFFVELTTATIQDAKTPVVIEVYSEGKKIDRIETNFLGPRKRRH
ncbi:MAG: cytochrome c oxidase accessory protein CcoG [Saprospiraceae bacterium]|nr:cytochrome c oxidase accessory protein CcoG [Saprospiraceae bacterium]